ncbi:MAG: hypothetical protein JXR70_15910, partial [Spirochaetales bacterium]|nr:hypothetical protein [Spirochaetales bacterium]
MELLLRGFQAGLYAAPLLLRPKRRLKKRRLFVARAFFEKKARPAPIPYDKVKHIIYSFRFFPLFLVDIGDH